MALLDGVIRVDLSQKLTFEQMMNGKMKIPAQENSNDLRWKQLCMFWKYKDAQYGKNRRRMISKEVRRGEGQII